MKCWSFEERIILKLRSLSFIIYPFYYKSNLRRNHMKFLTAVSLFAKAYRSLH